MKKNDNVIKSEIPSFKALRILKGELEKDLELIVQTNAKKPLNDLPNKIDRFLNMCDLILDASNISEKKTYSDKTLDQIECWANEWNEIVNTLPNEKIKEKSNFSSIISAFGRLFLIRPRRSYSDYDLPKLQPAQYSRQETLTAYSPYRDYSENDLPEYTPG